MNLNYKHQLILTVLLVLLGNVLNTILQQWYWRNIAYLLCAIVWIFHPVMISDQKPTKKQLNQIRFWGGGILLLMALFTRTYFY